MPISGGLDKAVRNGKDIGCSAVQVFTSSPRQWYAKPVTNDMVAAFRLACEETGIGNNVVSHDSYLINLAAPNDELRGKSKKGLLSELERCSRYGIPYVVSHIGALVGQPADVGTARAAEYVSQILEESPSDVTLLMETTAGQGSSLNTKFEEIADMLDRCKGHPRLGVCLDTCHVFAAGYDLRAPEAYEATMADFEKTVGFDRLKVVHCNDSKMPIDSRRDRHANLGDGEIGPVGFQCLVNDSRLETTPILIETPDEESMHAVNVQRLWDWEQS